MISRVPSSDQVTFSAHCHDDLGLAVANTLAAIGAGARQVECTVNGIGERAGNASLEEIVMAIRVRGDRLPYPNNITTQEIYASSQLLTALTGEAVQANKAIVGRNAFAHEAGIHQDGMLKDRRTYEIMRPEEVGVTRDAGARQALGPSRRAAPLRADRLHAGSPERSTRSTAAVIAHADREKVVNDSDLAAIVARVSGGPARKDAAPAPPSQDFSSTPAEDRLRPRRVDQSGLHAASVRDTEHAPTSPRELSESGKSTRS